LSVLTETDRAELLRLRERARALPSRRERRAIRIASGIAVDELAAIVGVDPGTIYRWERNLDPNRRHRDRYAELLEVLRGADE
jgi:DNA-binding XRE family transcriptional regulator